MTSASRSLGLEVRPALFEFYEKYAGAANSFLTLYRNYSHFEFTDGQNRAVLSYVDTPTAWIGASDPVGDLDCYSALIDAFAAAAKKQGKESLILPVSARTAQMMAGKGRFVVQIGSEPWVQLNTHRSRSDYMQMLPAARQLKSRGAEVDRFSPALISADEHSDLENLNKKWLRSRKSVPLGFLNQLDPWALMKYKMYFRLRFEGQPFGYLAAVPIPARNAWYLVDLIRDPEAPTGTTELLLVEAMDQLHEMGVQEITLGMSPLVPVDEHEAPRHPKLYNVLRNVFEHGDSFYNFRSLRNYKEKFCPSHWESLYLVGTSEKLSWRVWYGLFIAIYPKGLIKTTLQSIMHMVTGINLRPIVRFFLSRDIVTRALPTSIVEAVTRMKATWALTAINIMFFVLTVDPQGRIRAHLRDRYVYSWQHLVHANRTIDSFLAMVLPGVLHWNLFHLGFNLLMMVVAVGFTEILAGSTIAMTAYLAGSIFSNVLTTVLLGGAFYLFKPSYLPTFLNEVDIGCSLGIFACVGVVTHFTRFPKAITTLVVVASIIGTMVTGVTLELNHIIAMLIGFEIANKMAS